MTHSPCSPVQGSTSLNVCHTVSYLVKGLSKRLVEGLGECLAEGLGERSLRVWANVRSIVLSVWGVRQSLGECLGQCLGECLLEC